MKLSEQIGGWTGPNAEYDEDFVDILGQWVTDAKALEQEFEDLRKRLLAYSERMDWGFSVGTSDEATDEFYSIVHSMR